MRGLPILFLFLVVPALAQEVPPPPGLQPVPDGPPGQNQAQEGEYQPEVTIIRRSDGTIEEYRVNGRLYMVKVIPRLGVPYFLVDSDGNGDLETRYNDLDSSLLLPGWVIFSW